MERWIRSQRCGRGTSMSRVPSHHYKAELLHKKSEDKDTISGMVVGIEHDPARSVSIALVEFEDEQRVILAPEGISVGEELQIGVPAETKPGDALSLAEIPESVPICNVEYQPGDGGKLVRASGMSAQLLSYDCKVAIAKLLSGEVKRFNSNCRAATGVVAGGSHMGEPFVRVGRKYHRMKARDTKWPRMRGVAMNAIDHPFSDGGRQHPGQPKPVPRNAPPGRKVGDIASKRTGRGGKGGERL